MVDVAAEAANDPGREDGPAIDMDLSPKKQDGLQTPSSTHSTAAPDSPWGHGTMSSTSDSMMMDYQSEIPLAPLQERSSSAGSGRPRATQKKPKRQNQPGSIGCIGCTSPTHESSQTEPRCYSLRLLRPDRHVAKGTSEKVVTIPSSFLQPVTCSSACHPQQSEGHADV